jgi:ankyrin repeat protein
MLGQKLLNSVRENKVSEALALLKAGANATDGDYYDYTPLHWAVRNENFELINALIDKNAIQSAYNRYGRTPIDLASENLLKAARRNNTAKAFAWLNSIAHTNATDSDYYDYTPLHWAVRNDNFELTHALIEKGANQMAQDRYGLKPPLGKEVLEKIHKLSASKEDLFNAVKKAVTANDDDTALSLSFLDDGVIPSYCEPVTGYTALHWAAIKE